MMSRYHKAKTAQDLKFLSGFSHRGCTHSEHNQKSSSGSQKPKWVFCVENFLGAKLPTLAFT